jgi:serine/threonine protein kinase/predicted Zn-dependent protease
MIGQTISHYKITAKLGEGGMGEVYRATDTSLERQVALKFLPASLQSDPGARERLVREARAASKLNHKNILTIYAVESAEERDFIVMEYVEGRSLREILDSEDDLPIGQVVRIALQICDGLSSAHEAGIIHRDIKPANLLLTPKGQVKITDFGLATWRGASQLTKEGTTVGTAAYMAPEQIQGRTVDQRSDLFSLGVVLYELIARRRPFSGEHDAAISYAIINDVPEPLSRYKSALPPSLEQIIARALEKDPSTRYQTAADMLADLKRVKREIEGSQPSMASRSIAAAPVAPKRSALKYIVASSVVVVAAVVLLILKPFKLEVGGEQQASASEHSLAIMYFNNVPDPNDSGKMAQMITSLLITDLSESQYMKVVSRQRLYDLLRQLGKADATKIDENTASEVAKKAGVKFILTGDILQSSPRIIVSSQISDVASGDVVSSQKVTGNPGDDLFAVVDKLGAAVRADLTLPAQAKAEPDRPVADLTTRSADAYRYYLQGVDLSDKLYQSDAVASLTKALSYDSTLAMGYLYLWLDDVPDNQDDWIEKGMRHIDKAGWKEAHMLRGANAIQHGDLPTAVAEFSAVLERDPDDKLALRSRAIVYRFAARDFKAAAADLEHIVAIDPTDKSTFNLLAYVYYDMGDFDRSIRAINQYIALAPDEANPYDTRGDLYAYAGKLDEAIASFQKAIQIKSDFPSWLKLAPLYIEKGDTAATTSLVRGMLASSDPETRSKGRIYLAIAPVHEGDFAKGVEIIDQGLAADRLEGLQGEGYRFKLGAKAGILEAEGNFSAAITIVLQLRDLTRQVVPTYVVAYSYLLIEMYSQQGDFASADKELHALWERVKGRSPIDSSYAFYADGASKFWKGNYPDAVKSLERANALKKDEFFIAHMLARAYLGSGQTDKAVGLLESWTKDYHENRMHDPIDNVTLHYYLAQAYEKSGWNQKAADEYAKFLGIWYKADANLPIVADARKRLMALRS